MKLIIKQIGTNLKESLDEINSLKAIDAIKNSIHEHSEKIDIGLISPDIELSFVEKGVRRRFSLLNRGELIMDQISGKLYPFKYGNKLFQLMENKLKQLLIENPKYFME